MNPEDWFDRIDHDAVMDAMRDKGLTLSWEWPGVVAIHVNDRTQIWTGLHSYAYGDVSRQRPADLSWEPDEESPADLSIDEYETDPEVIAQAWADYVHANYGD